MKLVEEHRDVTRTFDLLHCGDLREFDGDVHLVGEVEKRVGPFARVELFNEIGE